MENYNANLGITRSNKIE
jgi:hypothetical protein